MKKVVSLTAILAFGLALFAAPQSQAQITLLADATLDQTRGGPFADVSGLKYNLESGVPANSLGGFGSAMAYASGNTFLMLPDRGPNAMPYDSNLDDTTSYINRFHTVTMDLRPNASGSGTPFTLTPTMRASTLLWSLTPLKYGSADGVAGSGVPPVNNFIQHFFTGRSDGFDPNGTSGDPNDARFDSEGMRVSNDGRFVFISDEYGPYVYEFDRLLGVRVRSFQLPANFYVSTLSSMGAVEIAGNTSGRVANKGMEGLAITPDGKTLVGIMQNSLIQDANEGATKVLRIVTIDILSGKVTHQYAYNLTVGSGVSEILALNSHEFLVDERDGSGREANVPPGLSTNAALNKKVLFKIDLAGATDVSALDGLTATANAVAKTPFVDVVALLSGAGFALDNIPSKIEGIAIGPDVRQGSKTWHTLWVSNDNDFVANVLDTTGAPQLNPNQIFVVGFTDADLNGTVLEEQHFTPFAAAF